MVAVGVVFRPSELSNIIAQVNELLDETLHLDDKRQKLEIEL